MRIALLYPEVYDMARFKDKRKEFPPFGVLYLAAVAERAGHDVTVEAVTHGRTRMDLTGYDAVGFSLASSATYNLMLQARRESEFADNSLIMVGGVHCNFYPESSLADFDADLASYGESDETIIEILDRAGSRTFTSVSGVMWRGPVGQVHRNPARPLMRDIDQLPLPARHLLPADHVVMDDRLAGSDLLMAHVMFSRGCPFPCSFCAAGQTRIQYRSGQSARIELEHLISSYSIKGFAIVDDNFIVNKAKVGDICDHITGLGLRWSALSRVDTIGSALLAKMANSGCIEIKYGMESGSETLLKAMRKNTTGEQIRFAVHATADLGIAAKVFIIHGFPGEDERTTNAT
jgi:anaerobic magnesium-protoporphyrin IX monomethyl ester cyclase